MKYLNTVLIMNSIEKNDVERASTLYLDVKRRLKDIPLAFDENAEMVLSNHIMALIKRLLDGKLVDPIDEEMMNEVSKKAWDYAIYIIKDVFEIFQVALDKSEVFLVGTHMEMALAIQTNEQ